MKKIKVILITLLFLSACKNWDFGDINNPPIDPVESTPKDLFSGGIVNFFNNTGRSYFMNPTLYIQWNHQVLYDSEMKYADRPISWTPYFVGVLSNFKENIKFYEENLANNASLAPVYGDLNNQLAANKVMYAYIFKFITDIYGDVPYSEALDDKNLTPKYDNQIDIYKSILQMLKEARDAFNPSAEYAMINGDVIYEGEVSKWRKLANSLLLHTALQLVDVDNATASQYITDAVNDGDFIEKINDEAWIRYLKCDEFLQNPISRFRDGDYCYAREFTDALKGRSKATPGSYSPTYNHSVDPRIMVYLNDPNKDGEPYARFLSRISRQAQFSSYIKGLESPLPFFTAAWTYLDRAEAAARGLSSENFDNLLSQAIQISIQSADYHWSQFTEQDAATYYNLAANYVTNRVADANDATYGGSTSAEEAKLRVIAEEKWVAYFPMGFEAWTQWRRLDMPELQPHPEAINTHGTIPVRYRYPGTEPTENNENYQAALQGLNPQEDNNEAKVRWDVN